MSTYELALTKARLAVIRLQLEELASTLAALPLSDEVLRCA